jgi:hypothetical protein
MGEGQFTDAMAQQTALWHIAFRDQAVGLTHASYSLAAVARNSHGGMKAPALQGGRYCQDLCIGEFQATSDPTVSGCAVDGSGVMSMGRSSSLPLWITAPARTRATKCGALTARQRVWAASISL